MALSEKVSIVGTVRVIRGGVGNIQKHSMQLDETFL